jgi:5-methylcytosine-specific restriction endonuclease McrA
LPPAAAGAEEKLFCSELCMQTADTLRYWRRVVRDGRIERPDVKEAVRTRVAFLLAGGYHRQARQLSEETRRFVRERDGEKCVVCGKQGEEIDHIDGDSDDPTNLQLLCKDCHHAKTAERMVPAGEEQRQFVDELLSTRVLVDPPRLLADDEIEWQKVHRGLKKARRDRLIAEMVDVGLDPSDYRGASRAAMFDALCDELAVLDEEGYFDEDEYAGDPGSFDGGYGPNSYFAHAMAKDD